LNELACASFNPITTPQTSKAAYAAFAFSIFFAFFSAFATTFKTARPRYLPQFVHTVWRRCIVPQSLQAERRGPVSAWCDRRFLV